MDKSEGIRRKAEEIADKYLSQIRFTYANFYDSDTSPFPAELHLDIPTAMLREYASIKSIGNIPEYHDESRDFLTSLWKEASLAEKLRSHEKVRETSKNCREPPIDMLDYLAGEDVYVTLSDEYSKRNLQSERVEIEILDMPTEEEDEGA